MKHEPEVVERLLAGLSPPEPPPGLQERTLRGARQVLTREAARDVWTRIWESRPLRIAWAVSVVVLVLCHFSITELRSVSGKAGTQTAGVARDGNGELAAIARLPRLDGNARPLLGARAYRLAEEVAGGRMGPANSKGKENRS
jgi:hypothetical protein